MTGDTPEGLQFLPIGLNVQGKTCLVVGGGAIGTRKVANLLAAGAAVKVVSPDITDELTAQAESGSIRWERDSYRTDHLEGVFLVIAATNDERLNATIVASAAERDVLACDVSSAERSRVIFGALHKGEDGVTVAVFTDGRDPAAARRTRDRIAGVLGGDTGSGRQP